MGGKGANLAEMTGHTKLRLPVPPGFTINTEVCTYYYSNKKSLLASIRSGAIKSMLGMMETVLNVGLNGTTIMYCKGA